MKMQTSHLEHDAVLMCEFCDKTEEQPEVTCSVVCTKSGSWH